MKKQLATAEEGRTQFEKTMISTYEQKLSLIQMNKDLTIDSLRKDLTYTKERQNKAESDHLNIIETLESEKKELEAELKAKIQHKNAEIQFLKNQLASHEQVYDNMKQEFDQLQSSMETISEKLKKCKKILWMYNLIQLSMAERDSSSQNGK